MSGGAHAVHGRVTVSHHGGRHRRACVSRRWRSPGCCATRGVAVVWLGVPGSMESRLVPANGFPIEWVRVGGIRGKGLKTWLLAPLRIVTAVVQALARAAPREAAFRAGRWAVM